MEVAYLRNCTNYADALNTIKFELAIPEYYDPTLPEYFKSSRPTDLPVINGELVSWDEYYDRFPEERARQKQFIPRPINSPMELNYTVAMATSSEIIDMCVNKVPMRFKYSDDIDWVLLLMDGYVNETKNFAGHHAELDRYLADLKVAREILMEAHVMNVHYVRLLRSKHITDNSYEALVRQVQQFVEANTKKEPSKQ